MARNTFMGGAVDWAFAQITVDGEEGIPQLQPGATARFYDQRVGGTQYTDLMVDDEPATEVTASHGDAEWAAGHFPDVLGPDDETIAHMWVSVDDGPRTAVFSYDALARHMARADLHGGPANYGTAGVIYVVANDANANDQARADYLCDGVDDHVQIQAALDESVTRGVELLLSAGTFQLEQTIQVSDPVRIRGFGALTTLRLGDAMNAYAITFVPGVDGIIGARIADFRIDARCDAQTTAGGGIDAAGGVECFFERIHVENAFDWGLVLGPINTVGPVFGHHNRVNACRFDSSADSAGHGGGIWITSSDENISHGCTFQFLGGADPVIGSSVYAVYDEAGLNTFSQCCWVGAREDTNCGGIRVQDVKMTQIIGCIFDGTGGDSITVSGRQHVVTGNTITSPGDQGDTPASGIRLEFGTVGTIVTGNSLETSVAAGKCHSLIRETGDGGAGSNIITGNSLYENSAPTVAMLDLSGAASVVDHNITL